MSDYISRYEIFSVWRSMPKPASISSLTEAINRTPAADVEPVRHGRWNVVEGLRLDNAICSNCGRHFQAYYEAYSFCPNCGAKMDGGDSDAKSV